MRERGRERRDRGATAAGLAALVILLTVCAGCGSGSGAAPSPTPTAQWRQVLAREISGAQPVKVNLGAYDLGSGARLQWRLSAPSTPPPVALTFRIINQTNGVGYGSTVMSRSQGFSLDEPAAIVLTPIISGKYVVFFSQRFPASKGPGYDASITVWTLTR